MRISNSVVFVNTPGAIIDTTYVVEFIKTTILKSTIQAKILKCGMFVFFSGVIENNGYKRLDNLNTTLLIRVRYDLLQT